MVGISRSNTSPSEYGAKVALQKRRKTAREGELTRPATAQPYDSGSFQRLQNLADDILSKVDTLKPLSLRNHRFHGGSRYYILMEID